MLLEENTPPTLVLNTANPAPPGAGDGIFAGFTSHHVRLRTCSSLHNSRQKTNSLNCGELWTRARTWIRPSLFLFLFRRKCSECPTGGTPSTATGAGESEALGFEHSPAFTAHSSSVRSQNKTTVPPPLRSHGFCFFETHLTVGYVSDVPRMRYFWCWRSHAHHACSHAREPRTRVTRIKHAICKL